MFLWSLNGAEADLKLRPLIGNDDLDNFTYHLKQETAQPQQPLQADHTQVV